MKKTKIPAPSTEAVLAAAGITLDGAALVADVPETDDFVATEAPVEQPTETAPKALVAEMPEVEEASAPEALAVDEQPAVAPVKDEPETAVQYRARWAERVWKQINNKAFSDEVKAKLTARHVEISEMTGDRDASDALKALATTIKVERAKVIRALVLDKMDKWLLWTPEGADEPVEGKWAEPFMGTAAYAEAQTWLEGLDKPNDKQFAEWMDQGYALLSKIENPFPTDCACGKNIRPILVKNHQDPDGPKVWWTPKQCGVCHKSNDLSSATKGKTGRPHSDIKKVGSASRRHKGGGKSQSHQDGEGGNGKNAGKKK